MPAARSRRFVAALALAAACVAPATASPLEYLPVGDPLEAELRVLDLYAPAPEPGRLLLPHADAHPVRFADLMGTAAAVPVRGARAITVARIERALARDATATFPPADVRGATPRLFQRAYPDNGRVEVSTGLEGRGLFTDAAGADRTRWADGSGVHLRGTAQTDRWTAHAHLWVGELRDVTSYSDALVANSNVALTTEDSWLSYDGGAAWDFQIGRSRWAWGPGEEGSLLLSRTAAPLSGMMLHLRIAPLRADAFVFNATTRPGRGEQLAAHRLEWQPADGVRLGLAEAARYHASGWMGLYVSGVVPYSVVQRLLDQDAGGATDTLRNNVLISADAAVRIADGSRAYGEIVIDDLHLRTGSVPNRLGFQLGWDGTGDVRGTRVTWNAEYTRLSRFVYTSSYGRDYTAQGMPIGFPIGPDAGRFRARVGWDPDADWQLTAIATRTVRGESGLDVPFVAGSPVPPAFEYAGTRETTRTLEGALRYWPATGVDVALSAGREWVEDAGHVAGASRADWRGSLSVRLVR